MTNTSDSEKAQTAAQTASIGADAAANSLKSPAETSAITPATVVPGHGYPADRLETSPESTGWRASGAGSTSLGTTGKLMEVSRETFR
jgi:hypothetical protein